MPRSLMLSVLLAAAASLGACGDDSHDDLGGPVDLLGADLPVSLPDLSVCPIPFQGFPGDSPSERRLDCTLCGCEIDSLSKAAEEGLWAKTSTGATLTDSTPGIYILTDGVSGPAFATLSSLNVAGPFYLDGDFDLRVDYLISLQSYATHVALRVDLPDGTFYEVARKSSSTGSNTYAAQLGGLATAIPAAVDQGTLRLVRTATTITAYGDADQVGKNLASGAGRVALYLSAGIDGCFAADGGSCTLVTTLHDVRLTTGALVDRR